MTLLHPTAVEFFVPGTPVPQGSMVPFICAGTGKARTKATNKEKLNPWRTTVSLFARGAWKKPINSPVRVSLRFVINRKKSVKRPVPSVKPDIDKLVRAVLDGMTGVVFDDDARVVGLEATKEYGPTPGVHVSVCEAL